MVMDKNGKQLATKVCVSNLKMWHEPMNSDLLPNWIKPSQIPDPAEVVQEQLDESKKNKKAKRKKEALKKAKPNTYLKKLYGDNLQPCHVIDKTQVQSSLLLMCSNVKGRNHLRIEMRNQVKEFILQTTYLCTHSQNTPAKGGR